MPLPVLLGACAIAASVPLLWWSVATANKPARAASRRLLGPPPAAASTDLRQAVLNLSAAERAGQPLVRGLANRARRLTPYSWVESLERRLTRAGRPIKWPLERLLAAKLLLGLAGLSVGFLLFTSSPSIKSMLLLGFTTALGYFAPDLLLVSRGQERQAAVRDALPDTLDQMTVAVEAGLGFDAAMARAGRTGEGPLAEELVRTLQEVQVGVARTQALRNLADRTDVPDLRHFVLAIIQAEGYGIPVAEVLRIQAAEMRVKRKQRAEERAMKIPVKVIFPLILCILPTLFIVILGPAAIQISREMFGAGGGL